MTTAALCTNHTSMHNVLLAQDGIWKSEGHTCVIHVSDIAVATTSGTRHQLTQSAVSVNAASPAAPSAGTTVTVTSFAGQAGGPMSGETMTSLCQVTVSATATNRSFTITCNGVLSCQCCCTQKPVGLQSSGVMLSTYPHIIPTMCNVGDVWHTPLPAGPSLSTVCCMCLRQPHRQLPKVAPQVCSHGYYALSSTDLLLFVT